MTNEKGVEKILEQAAVEGIISCPGCGATLAPDCPECGLCGWRNALIEQGFI